MPKLAKTPSNTKPSLLNVFNGHNKALNEYLTITDRRKLNCVNKESAKRGKTYNKLLKGLEKLGPYDTNVLTHPSNIETLSFNTRLGLIAFKACRDGNEKRLKKLLDTDLSIKDWKIPNTSDFKDYTHSATLACISAQSSENCLQILISKNADINASTKKDKYSPLHFAVNTKYEKPEDIERNKNCVRLLLDAKANLEAENQEGKTPFEMASRNAQYLYDIFADKSDSVKKMNPLNYEGKTYSRAFTMFINKPGSLKITMIGIQDENPDIIFYLSNKRSTESESNPNK